MSEINFVNKLGNSFFIKLSIVNGLLLGLLILILIALTNFIWVNHFVDIAFPVLFMFLGAYIVGRSDELPLELAVVLKVALFVAFLGIFFLYIRLIQDWNAGVFEKPPYKDAVQEKVSN